tara:strand:- start:3412 stop:3585 length:174 start_codon:yes stop_codon:yes gene_type:complete
MKNENNILDIRIYGKTILIDYDKEEIVFPDNIREVAKGRWRVLCCAGGRVSRKLPIK